MSKVDETEEDPVGLPRPVVVLAFGAGAIALAGSFIAAAELAFWFTTIWIDVDCCTTTTTTIAG